MKILIFLTLLLQTLQQQTQEELISQLKREGFIKSREVEQIFQKLDRKFFTEINPYQDAAQKIGYNATISAPHMHAQTLEILKDHLKGATKCLDIGFGSGFMSAAMRLLMTDIKNSILFGIDHIRDFVAIAEDNFDKAGVVDLILDYKVVLIQGDGRLGLKRQAKFDCINVGAAFQYYPFELENQLRYGGRMVLPVGSQGKQELLIVDKDLNGMVTKRQFQSVLFIPMTDLELQCPSCKEQEDIILEKLKQPIGGGEPLNLLDDLEFDFDDDDL